MDPRKQFTPYEMYNGPPSMPAMSSSMPTYAPSARRGTGNFGRGGYGSMSRGGGGGGGGKRGAMASRGGHHRGPKPVLDQNNFLSYSSSSSSPYQGQQQHLQPPIVPFHQRANEYNMNGTLPTVPDTSYYHASTQQTRTRKENYHWDSKRNEDGKSLCIFFSWLLVSCHQYLFYVM